MHVHFIVYLLALWFLVSTSISIFRLRTRIFHAAEADRAWHLNPSALINLAAASFVSVSILLGAGLFFQGRELVAFRILALIILATSAVDTLVAFRSPHSPKISRRMQLAPQLLSILLAFCALSFIYYVRSTPPTAEGFQRLSYPVKGSWRVVSGGRTGLTNDHHDQPPAQSYAVDLVYDEGPSEGRPVYAPIEGLVIVAVNDRLQGDPEPEGNVVVIRSEDGTEVWMAHLREGSVLVTVGDRVAREQIAECGSTGSAVEAHLHIHAQRGITPVPMLFGDKGAFLLRNDRLKIRD